MFLSLKIPPEFPNIPCKRFETKKKIVRAPSPKTASKRAKEATALLWNTTCSGSPNKTFPDIPEHTISYRCFREKCAKDSRV